MKVTLVFGISRNGPIRRETQAHGAPPLTQVLVDVNLRQFLAMHDESGNIFLHYFSYILPHQILGTVFGRPYLAEQLVFVKSNVYNTKFGQIFP